MRPAWCRHMRPWNIPYGCHFAFSVSWQVMVLSRIFLAVETEYTFKLSVIRYCDIFSGFSLILGFIVRLPYIVSVIRCREIVLSPGPSLLTELLPQIIANFALLFAVCLCLYVDTQIAESHQITPLSLCVYGGLGLFGLLIAVVSNENHTGRSLCAITLISVCFRQPRWFSDWQLTVPITLALCLQIALLIVSPNPPNTGQLAREISRIKLAALFVCLLSIWTHLMNEFGIFALFSLLVCNCVLSYTAAAANVHL